MMKIRLVNVCFKGEAAQPHPSYYKCNQLWLSNDFPNVYVQFVQCTVHLVVNDSSFSCDYVHPEYFYTVFDSVLKWCIILCVTLALIHLLPHAHTNTHTRIQISVCNVHSFHFPDILMFWTFYSVHIQKHARPKNLAFISLCRKNPKIYWIFIVVNLFSVRISVHFTHFQMLVVFLLWANFTQHINTITKHCISVWWPHNHSLFAHWSIYLVSLCLLLFSFMSDFVVEVNALKGQEFFFLFVQWFVVVVSRQDYPCSSCIYLEMHCKV